MLHSKRLVGDESARKFKIKSETSVLEIDYWAVRAYQVLKNFKTRLADAADEQTEAFNRTA